MRIPWVCLSVGLLFASHPANAAPVISIDGFETIFLNCDITLTPFVAHHLQIVASAPPGDTPLHGVEFAILGLPSSVFATVTPNPAATLLEGGPFSAAGARIMLPGCTAGQRVVLYDVDLIALSPATFQLHLVAHPQPSVPNTLCPSAFLCDNTMACATGGLNALGPSGATPTPANHAAGVPLDAVLQVALAGGFPCGCASTPVETLYFGTDPNPPQLATGELAFPFDPGTLTASTTYYWRFSMFFCGVGFDSPVWSFTTGNPLGVEAHAWTYIKDLYR